MGKKNKKKNKNKISGSIKTALKTEKKLNAKQRKELAALGEEDIEKIVAEIEREEAHRQCIKEVVINAPSRRVNFTLTAHPFKDELIMFGGEFHNGRQTLVYGDMFFYNINKRDWTLLKAPGAPPPRCGHQAVVTMANQGGEFWIFGGEFTSPYESQFYHYRDLWVFKFANKKWEKITASNGPSARSGHRMVHVKKQLIVFGGFHDNLRGDFKYFNDVYIFDLEMYTWQKIEPLGVLPAPRSGCILLPTADNKLVVYGGFSKEKLKKDTERGRVHADMFLLQADKNNPTKYKWVCIKQTGIRINPRCGASAILIQPNQAFVFGGVYDDEEDNDDDNNENHGTFYNDLFALDLEKLCWRTVTLTGKKEATSTNHAEERKRRRRKLKVGDNKESGESNDSEKESEEELEELPVQSTVTDDGIFMVTIGSSAAPSLALNNLSLTREKQETIFFPSPRMNAAMTVKHNVLYLYGGIVEQGDRQYTLCDFYSMDCRKLNEWKSLIADDLSSQEWFDSDDSEEDKEDEDEDEEDNDDDEDED